MMFKKSLIHACIGLSLISVSGLSIAAESDWALPSGNDIAGDAAYWGTKDEESSNPESARWDSNNIYADSVNKEAKVLKNKVPTIRAEAIKSAAVAFGTQAGLANRASKINKALKAKETYYNQVFNFNTLQLEPGFLPPVISEGRDAYNQPSDDEVRAADHLYKIEFPARIVNVVPRWQEYLIIQFSDPKIPDNSVLSKNSAEKELWDSWVEKGFEMGVAQADEEFDSRLGRLKRDFEGMLRFKRLYEQGMVSKPTLARSELGVTGGGDEMAVGDRVIKVTNKAQLNPEQKRWLSSSPK